MQQSLPPAPQAAAPDDAAAQPPAAIDALPLAPTRTLAQTRKQLRQDKDLINQMQIGVNEVRKDYDEVKMKNAALKERTKKLTELLAGGASMKETIARMQSEHALAQGKVDSLTEEIARNEETTGRLTVQNDALRHQIAAVTISTEGLADQQKRLSADNARMKELAHQQRAKFKEAAPTLMDEIAATKEKYTSAFDEVHSLEVTWAKETAKRDEASAESDRVKEQLDQAFAQNTQMNDQQETVVKDGKTQHRLHKDYNTTLGNVKSIVDLTIAGLNRDVAGDAAGDAAVPAAEVTLGDLTDELAAEVDLQEQMGAATAEVPAASGDKGSVSSIEEFWARKGAQS